MEGESERWSEEESFLAEVFQQCDRDGSGYITRDELAALCRSHEQMEEGRLDALMSSLDADKDGHISFEEFKAGFKAYSSGELGRSDTGITNSTPKHTLCDSEEVYESAVGSEFSWEEAAERLDPEGLLQGMGVEKVWKELARGDPAMLEPFESFLSEVVLQMKNNQQDKNELQGHIKKIVREHSREVTEMEQILQEQVLRAQEDSMQKNVHKTSRLSSHYSSLLADQEALLETLREKETALQKTLSDKVTSETILKEEKRQLITANKELREKLSCPRIELSTPNGLPDETNHQRRRSSKDEPGCEWTECLEDEPECLWVVSSSPHQQSTKSSHNQPSQQLEDSHGKWVESACVQMGEQLVDSSDNNQVECDSTVRSSVRASECVESSLEDGAYCDDKEHLKGDTLDEERPRPLGEDISLTHSLLAENSSTSALTLGSPSSGSVVHRVFKVAFLGDSGVGKSSLILQLCEGRFNASCVSTLGLDFSTKMLTVGDEIVVFQLWDTAGQERFRNALTPVYLRRSDAFVIVYDVTSRKSFKSCKSWLSIVSAALREQPPVVMLVGNKTDQQSKREVTSEDGRELALELRALFSETSALSGDNVLEAHTTLAQLLLTRENEQLDNMRKKALDITNSAKRKKCSC